jgi:hypothetical protein
MRVVSVDVGFGYGLAVLRFRTRRKACRVDDHESENLSVERDVTFTPFFFRLCQDS